MVEFSVVLPYQFYNLIMVFVTILALLWGAVALKRVYRMLRIRSAVLSDRIIQIRGLGSYLTYFDGAMRSHLDAVVHTRQSMPPVQMHRLSVRAVVNNFKILAKSNVDNFSVHFNAVASCRTRVILSCNFSSANFQQMLLDNRRDGEFNTPQSHSRNFHTLTGLREDIERATAVSFPKWQRGEICSFECLCSEITSGEHKIELPLIPMMNSWLGDKLRGRVGAENICFAVTLVPLERSHDSSSGGSGSSLRAGKNLWKGVSGARGASSSGSYSGTQMQSSSSRGQQAVELGSAISATSVAERSSSVEEGEAGLLEEEPLSSGSGRGGGVWNGDSTLRSQARDVTRGGASANHQLIDRNPMISTSQSSDTSVTGNGWVGVDQFESESEQFNNDSMFAATFVHSLPVSSLIAASTAVASMPVLADFSWSVALPTAELVVLDSSFNLFLSQEVFGLLPAVKTSGGSGSGFATPTVGAAGEMNASGDSEVACMGGIMHAEDCVVCLTDPKSVVLLPCRHLCVCETCLVFLDKCPVCRAAFEEYITTSHHSSAAAATPNAAVDSHGSNDSMILQQLSGETPIVGESFEI